MISKIKSVKPVGTEPFLSKNGLLYGFYYEFEDGVKLLANHKTETPRFSVGDTAEYSITKQTPKGNLGKVDRPKPEDLNVQSTAIKPMEHIKTTGHDHHAFLLEGINDKLLRIMKHLGIEEELPF